MSEKVIFYFHGYGSSPATDKVARLKETFKNVYAFPIDIDPEKSIPYLERKIEETFLELVPSQEEIIFIGTSLGGWYAAYLGAVFHVRTILINPAYNFGELTQFGVPQEILAKYKKIGFYPPLSAEFYISENDEVINFEPYKKVLSIRNVTWVPNAGHRFNGPEFDSLIEKLNTP